MIKKLTIYLILFLPVCLNSQSIVEKFRTEGQARNPLKQFIRNTDDSENAIEDFNGNGTLDLVSFKGSDEELQIEGIDGGTYEEIFNINVPAGFLVYPNDEVSRIPLLYPIGTGLDYLIITMTNLQEGDRSLIINPQNENDFVIIPGRVVLTADMDGDGWIDVLSIDAQDRSLVVHGIDNGSGVRKDVPFSGRSKGDLTLLFQSDPDVVLNIDEVVFRSSKSQDVNNDGIVDITIVRRNEDDDVTGLRVVDLLTKEIIFQKNLEDIDGDINRFHGYFDIDGDEVKEVLIGENLIVNQSGVVTAIGSDFRIEAILDVNGDDVDDVVGVNATNNTIEIWGLSNSTSVEDFQSNLSMLFNFPNPFQASTTIHYSLEQPGDVLLKIFDASGGLFMSKALGKRPAGINEEVIGFLSATEGVYYYSITVGGKSLTQKMIKL